MNENTDQLGFQHCWEYYQCFPEKMKRCPAFKMGFDCKDFSDCWFFIKDPLIGGPEKHGPCAHCQWNNTYGLFKNGGYLAPE